MTTQSRTHQLGRFALGFLTVVVVIAVGWWITESRRSEAARSRRVPASANPSAEAPHAVVDVLDLPEHSIKAMRLQTVPAVIPRFSKVLHLRGTLQIDPNRLSHVHARFPGQIVELATVASSKIEQSDAPPRLSRTLQNFDYVEQGVKLAVIRSKDLGEKKSQLAEAMTKLRVEQKTLDSYKVMTEKGVLSDRQYREQEAKFEQAKIAVFTAESTLIAFQVTKAEIDKVKESAEKYHRGQEVDKFYEDDWSRVVVTAPISGDIVEKGPIVGDIVDANADLFKIADLSVLAVYLHPYEEDLPALEQLPKPLQVMIRIPAYPELGELQCDVDRFSPMIDPNEHMALLIGTVKNPHRSLLSGQFITADVGIPTDKGVVEIPSNAVIDFGSEAIVFVRPDPSKPQFQRRRVNIVQRYFNVVYVRSELTDEQKQQGLLPVQVDDEVVTGGILELEDYLEQLR